MSIATYAELQTAIASWLNRDDLSTVIPTFISLAEATNNRRIRHWQMEVRAEADFDERYEVLPLDWREPVRLTVGREKTVRLVSHVEMMRMREENGNASGEPRFYAITSGQIELFPTPDGVYQGSMVYYADIPALTDADPVNWLLLEYPDAYLYGSLVHSAPFLHEDERMTAWAALHESAIEAINTESARGTHGGTGLRMKIGSY